MGKRSKTEVNGERDMRTATTNRSVRQVKNSAISLPGMRRFSTLGTATLLTLLMGATAHAQTWNGTNAGNILWSTSANWTGGVPTTGGSVIFGTGTQLTSNLDYNVSLLKLTFNSGASAYVVSSTTGKVLTLTTTGVGIQDSSTNTETISAAVALNGNQSWDVVSGGTLLVSGIVSGGFNLTKTSAGTLVLSGNNTFTGTLTLANTAGNAVEIGAGGTTGSLASGNVVVNTNSVLRFNRSNALGYGGIISGSGSLTQKGTGTTTLTGANTFNGAVAVTAGTLALGAGGAFNAAGIGTLTLNNTGSTFDISAGATSNLIVTSLTGTGSTTLNLGANTLTANQSTNTTYAGVIQGTGNVIKNLTGTLTLSGANSFSGGLTANAGTVVLSGANTSTGAITVNSNAGVEIGAGSTTGSIDNVSSVVLNGTGTTSGILRFNRSDSYTYGGVISGSGGRVTQKGSGTTILTGANTFGGQLGITAGTVQVGNGGTVGSIDNAASVSFSNGTTLAFNRSDNIAFGGTISGGTGTLKQMGTGTLTLNGASTSFTGTLNVASGTVTFGSANLWNNSATLTVATGGTLNTGGAQRVSALNVAAGSTANLTGQLTLGTVGGSTDTISGTVQGSGGLFLYNHTSMTVNGAANLTFGGPLVVANGARLTLDNTGTNSIALQVGSTGFGGADTVTLNRDIAIGSLASYIGPSDGLAAANDDASSGIVNVGSHFLTIGSDNTSTSYEAFIKTNSDGGLIKVGSGTFSLNHTQTIIATNVFNGSISVLGGSFVLGASTNFVGNHGDIFPGFNGLTVSNGSTFDFSADVDAQGPTAYLDASFLTGTSGGTVAMGTGNLRLSAASGTTTFDGVITGSGFVDHTGTSTQILTGANTFTGGLQVNAGTVQLGNGATTGSISDSSNVAVATGATFGVNRSNTYTYGGVISGAGNVENSGNGTFVLTGDSTLTGKILVDSGTVQVGNGGTTGSVTNASKIEVATGATIAFNRSDASSYDGVIADRTTPANQHGSVVKSGAGTLALNGINTFTGDLTVNGGSVTLGATGAFASGGIGALALNNSGSNLDISAGLTSNLIVSSLSGDSGTSINLGANKLTAFQATTTTYNGVITGTGGSFVKNGVGTLNVTGVNTYTGPTTVDGGVLNLTGKSSSSNATINSGGTLATSGTGAGAGNQAVNNITLNSGGTLDPGDFNNQSTTAKLYANSMTWNAGGVWHMIERSSSAASDEIILAGSLVKGGTGSYVVDFSGTLAADLNANLPLSSSRYKVQIAQTGTGLSGFTAADFSYTGLPEGFQGMFKIEGNDLFFVNYLLPEPGTVGMMLFAGVPMAMLAVRRSRRNRK